MNVRFLALVLCVPVLVLAQVSQFIDQQRDFVESPTKLTRGKNAVAAAAVIAATVSLMAVDHRTEPYLQRTVAFRPFDDVFTGKSTEIGIIAAPAALFATGLLRADKKMQRTSVLAAESAVDAELAGLALKHIVHRTSPGATSNESFPSGHTITAFAAATVIAHRYGSHKWVPVIAYGLAGAIGFSRVTSGAHFASDVFDGATLGYVIGRFTDFHGSI